MCVRRAANFGQNLAEREESLTGEEGPAHSGNDVAAQKIYVTMLSTAQNGNE